jgi:hypothetical protein
LLKGNYRNSIKGESSVNAVQSRYPVSRICRNKELLPSTPRGEGSGMRGALTNNRKKNNIKMKEILRIKTRIATLNNSSQDKQNSVE